MNGDFAGSEPNIDTSKIENSSADEGSQIPELTEEQVLSYIGKRYNKEISNLDELFEQRTSNDDLDPEVATYLKYKKETGRGIEDFIQLNKDYDSMDQDQLLFEYRKNKDRDLDVDDIRFDLENQFGYDSDFDDEKEIKKKHYFVNRHLLRLLKNQLILYFLLIKICFSLFLYHQ